MGISEFQLRQMLEKKGMREATPKPSDFEPVESGEEMGLHRKIMEHCNKQWPPWAFIHCWRKGRSGVTPGAPDFVIYSPHGKLSFEVKTKTGKRSPDQVIFAHLAKQAGHEIEIVRSMPDFLNLIEKAKKRSNARFAPPNDLMESTNHNPNPQP